jgi:hypothetical protein
MRAPVGLFTLCTVFATSCQKSPSPRVDQAPSVTPAAPSATPQKSSCLELAPGKSLGPVRLGMNREEIEKLGLPIEEKSKHEGTELLKAGAYQVELCGGKVVEVWLQDLRAAPSCLAFGEKTIQKDLPREQVIARFSECKELPPRKGGSFTECEGGGLRLGYGMGDFLQVRVTEQGSKLDDTCEMRLDDGGTVALAPEVLAKLLQQTLDIDQLAQFWHSNLKGRDPLRVIDNEVVPRTAKLSMFGNPVTLVPRATALKDKQPYFEFARVTTTLTKTTIEFSYPVEGVVGKTVFEKHGSDWRLVDKDVAER